MVNKIIISIVCIILTGGICFGLYWRKMSNAERWLFFNKPVALQYSKQLLAPQPTVSIPSELIDMHISTKAGVVTFDPNDQDHFFVLAYSPNGSPEPIKILGQTILWKDLKHNWYELLISAQNSTSALKSSLRTD